MTREKLSKMDIDQFYSCLEVVLWSSAFLLVLYARISWDQHLGSGILAHNTSLAYLLGLGGPVPMTTMPQGSICSRKRASRNMVAHSITRRISDPL
jgi:hypothetical protein